MPKTIRAEIQPSVSPAPVSPAHRELSAALSELRAAERGVEVARAPVPRLEAEIAAETAARAALDRLDADYARRMASWAAAPEDYDLEDGDGDDGPEDVVGVRSVNPPDPDFAARAKARLTLDTTAVRGAAARDTLAALATCIAEADSRLGAATGSIKPAVARLLREEGDWLAAEYWRRYADLEQVRRELAALDQVLMTDFPIAHAPTGRTIVDWVSPEKLPAPALAGAADKACAGLEKTQDFIVAWREKARAWAG